MKEEDLDEDDPADALKSKLKLPEENILYFLEKHSPILKTWEREIVRIVRNIAQYFYPQAQTKIMNEGCATFVDHYVMNELFDRGLLTEGAMLEYIHVHSHFIFQPDFDDPRYNGINPYALGFAMMQDIRQMCEDPTEEDREWFPNFAGSHDWREVLKDAWANYQDESFILQYLSPRLMRRFKLFVLQDEENRKYLEVTAIHDVRGFRDVRRVFARSRSMSTIIPNIQVESANLTQSRKLVLCHEEHSGIPLDEEESEEVQKYVRRLWGHKVELFSRGA